MRKETKKSKMHKMDLHYLRLLMFWVMCVITSLLAHIIGDSVRGYCAFGGDMFLPFFWTLIFYVYCSTKEKQR